MYKGEKIMKFAKRLTAFVIVAVMLATSCMFVSAATATVTVNGTYTVDTGVTYSKLTVKSGQNGNTVTGVSLEFDPDDGYFPMVFAPYAGSANVLADYYSVATGKYGYDVAGIINGSFFDTATDHLIGLNISNGRITCAHSGYSDEVVAFDTNGKMSIVTSCLDYKLFIDGKEVPNALRYINKRYENDTWGPDKIFYYDTSCGTIADTSVAGYEVVCEKVNNSDLMVGGTLFGKVVSVGTDTYGTKFETDSSKVSNRFVLFVKTDSAYAQYLKDLKAGDDVAISVTETIADAKEVMENANSVITNVGWLVKDGVDRTRIDSTIGTHSVTLQARWTAFGQKADGSYVFFTTEGASTGSSGSVTLRDVADYMISKGCVNVIRMDGGGSSAMYLKKTSSGSAGYAQYSSRQVTDGIMVVKKSSAVDSSLVTALNTAIANAKASVASTPNESLSAAIADAEAAVAKGNVVSGDARALIYRLSGKSELFELALKVSGISYHDYSEDTLSSLRADYAKALELYFSGDATAAQIQSVTASLYNNFNNSVATVISRGASYTTTAPNRGDGNVHNDDGVRLTDGSKCNAGASTNAYSGWSNSVDPVITVDLGSAKQSDTYTVYAGSMASWGIPKPNGLKVEVSSNGSTWTTIGSSTGVIYRQADAAADTAKTNYYSFTVRASEVQNARYVRFTVDGANHTWLDEVEVALSNTGAGTAVENAIYINGVNKSITAGDCHIFTPAFGTVTGTKANHNYTTNVVLKKSSGNAYTVKSITAQNGSAPDITLASDELLLACHNDANVPGSAANIALLLNAGVGDTLYIYGVDTVESTLGVASYASFGAVDANTAENVALGKDYTVTGVYMSNGSTADYPDENGKTMTDGLNAAADGKYNDPAYLGFNANAADYQTLGYATITVDLGEKYLLDKFVAKVASSYATSGIVAPKEVSVYVSDDNANWTFAGTVNPIDTTAVSTISATIKLDAAVSGRYVQFRIVSGANWIMVAEVEAYGTVDSSAPAGDLGDVNGDDKIDSADYLLVKRACFGSYTLTEEAKLQADIDKSGKVDSTDYVLIKRMSFGTFVA